MRRTAILLVGAVLMLATSLPAQDFSYCADMNDDGTINIMDVVLILNELCYEVPTPEGKGDVDFRADRTMGDIRYINGYLFHGYLPGGCPPFDPYPINVDADTIFLPAYTVPAGSGSFMLPIVMRNTHTVTDFVIPFAISGLDATIEFDSVQIPQVLMQASFANRCYSDDGGTIYYSGFDGTIEPGMNLLATLYFHSNGSTGGTVLVDTASASELNFPHYVYGDIYSTDYSTMTIAAPVVISGTVPFPMMSVVPDTLKFQTLVDYPDPAPKSFTVLSDGAPFSWVLTHTDWLSVDKMSGMSGESVAVTPHIEGLSVGTHVGNVLVYSSEALGSPKQVTISIFIKAQYPSLDANCDGVYNISDIVLQLQYIFGNGQIPCDPCTGEPLRK